MQLLFQRFGNDIRHQAKPANLRWKYYLKLQLI